MRKTPLRKPSIHWATSETADAAACGSVRAATDHFHSARTSERSIGSRSGVGANSVSSLNLVSFIFIQAEFPLDLSQWNRLYLLGALVKKRHQLCVSSGARNLFIKLVNDGDDILGAVGSTHCNSLLPFVKRFYRAASGRGMK